MFKNKSKFFTSMITLRDRTRRTDSQGIAPIEVRPPKINSEMLQRMGQILSLSQTSFTINKLPAVQSYIETTPTSSPIHRTELNRQAATITADLLTTSTHHSSRLTEPFPRLTMGMYRTRAIDQSSRGLLTLLTGSLILTTWTWTDVIGTTSLRRKWWEGVTTTGTSRHGTTLTSTSSKMIRFSERK